MTNRQKELETEPHVQIQELAKQNKRRLTGVLISASISVLVFAAVVGIVLSKALTSSQEATDLARANRTIVHEIQHERLENCLDQNRRHDNSLNYIISLARKEAKGASAHKQAELQKSIGEYRILFQALAPKQNCAQVVGK
jgi:hypothetical protein